MKSNERLQRASAYGLALHALLIWAVGFAWQSSATGVGGNQAVPMGDRIGIATEKCVEKTCDEAVHGTSEPPAHCPHLKLLDDGSEHVAEVCETRSGGESLYRSRRGLAPSKA